MKETTRRTRAGLLAALVALLMVASALPASADPGDTSPLNITWESSGSIDNITWEFSGGGGESLLNITWE